MASYIPRVIDTEITRALTSSGAVVLEGPRAVGKTESGRQFCNSELRLDSADPLAELARIQPDTALEGRTPRLLDEYQLSPGLWNAVRHEIDDRNKRGQFILTGSALPSSDPLRHSGAGRFRHIGMRTMTLAETGHSTAEISLKQLLTGADISLAKSEISFKDVIARLVVGGWPGWYDIAEEDAQLQASAYLTDLAQHDFPQIGGPNRDPRRMMSLLRAIAGVLAQPASFAAITRRMRDAESRSFDERGIAELVDLAEQMFVLEDQPAWAPKLRSRQVIHQSPNRHLADTSLAAALLGAKSERLLAEPETLGFFFESQVVHDVNVYAQAAYARGVFHYRDAKGRDEIDVIVEASDGSWIGIEVKLTAQSADQAAKNLLRVAAKIERQPTHLVVMVPTGIAHRRQDGVLVIPLTCLGP
ncbi:MAG: AAA family ATPase [Actinomycetales bacterium]|nr:MAG: AAA family ATPase [Actinomycetales bacterium]